MNEARETPHGRCTGQEKPLATPPRSLGGRAGLDPTWGRGEGDTCVHQTPAGKKGSKYKCRPFTPPGHLTLPSSP